MERIYILRNFILTLPSIVYHGAINIYLKFSHDKKDNLIFNEVDTKNLILLVHGFHGHPCNFVPLVNNMITHDTSIKNKWNIIAINLNQFDNYRDNTVNNEANIVINFLENSAYDNVILVGLSKGGLVCTTVYSMNIKKIIKVITLSSPLMGTKSCDLFLPKTLDVLGGNNDNIRHDLNYLSSTSLTTLNTLVSNNLNCNNIYHVIPKYDHMIYPSSSAKYDFAKKENVYEYDTYFSSHIGVTFDKKISIKMIEWIKDVCV